MNILNCEHALPVVVHIYIQECLNFVYVRYLESLPYLEFRVLLR